MLSKPKTWTQKEWLTVAIILFVFVAAISQSVKTSSTDTNQENSTSSATAEFQKATLSDLVTSKVDSGALVKIQGTVTKKGEYTDTKQAGANKLNFFLKIEDEGVSVIVLSKQNILSNLAIGDLLEIRGINGTLGDCDKPDDQSVKELCQTFNVKETNTRIVTPIPLESNGSGIVVVKKASVRPPDVATAPTQQSAPAIVQQAIAQKAVTIDYSQFTPTYFYNFAGDPPAYLEKQIKVKGIINNQFLAAGDKGGNSNYIGVADPNARASGTVMLKISSNTDYQKAVAALQNYDLVAAYGSGALSEYFTMNGGSQVLVPVIEVTRIDSIGACGPSGCGEDSTKTIFP